MTLIEENGLTIECVRLSDDVGRYFRVKDGDKIIGRWASIEEALNQIDKEMERNDGQ